MKIVYGIRTEQPNGSIKVNTDMYATEELAITALQKGIDLFNKYCKEEYRYTKKTNLLYTSSINKIYIAHYFIHSNI